MKKYLPFLWFYPLIAYIVSIFVVSDTFDTNHMVGMITCLLAGIADICLALVYYRIRINHKPLMLIAGPVLFALMFVANINIINDGNSVLRLLLICAIPTASSVLFMLTVRLIDQKTGAADKTQPAPAPAASVAPPAHTPASVVPASAIPVEELNQLKKLFDSGIITEEEFEAKKKQLLGL